MKAVAYHPQNIFLSEEIALCLLCVRSAVGWGDLSVYMCVCACDVRGSQIQNVNETESLCAALPDSLKAAFACVYIYVHNLPLDY